MALLPGARASFHTSIDTVVDAARTQASGQGPYFGQAAHFKMFAPEKIPYGIKRYADEIVRVLGVLESVLADGREWLMAGKCTIADLSYITWCVHSAFRSSAPVS